MNGRRQSQAGQIDAGTVDADIVEEEAAQDAGIDLGLSLSVYGKTAKGDFVIIKDKPAARPRRAGRNPGDPTQH